MILYLPVSVSTNLFLLLADDIRVVSMRVMSDTPLQYGTVHPWVTVFQGQILVLVNAHGLPTRRDISVDSCQHPRTKKVTGEALKKPKPFVN